MDDDLDDIEFASDYCDECDTPIYGARCYSSGRGLAPLCEECDAELYGDEDCYFEDD